MTPIIVGLGGLLGDPSCCVMKDGRFVAAVEQSKVSRHDRLGAFPDEAFETALDAGRIKREDITCVAIARPFAIGSESSAQLQLRSRFPNSEIVVVEHHYAHAASAFYLSGFEKASVLSIDRAGDFRSAVLFAGEKNNLAPLRELYYPDSLGDLFNRVTELLGFEPRADEHKVQWLSTMGEPAYVDAFRQLLYRDESIGWPRMNRRFIDADQLAYGGFSSRFFEALQVKRDEISDQIVRANIAASLQLAINEAVAGMLGKADHVCLAGGLGLNALVTASLEARFPHAFVQPASGNAGTSLGAALHAWHNFYGESQRVPFETLCLGPEYRPEDIKRVIENCKLRAKYLVTGGDLLDEALRVLGENKILAWMNGRMEFGPRALGNRSILASPLNSYSTENLNVYIKHRENFRKFAASVPAEHAAEYFEVGPNSRYLGTVGKVRPQHAKTFQAAILGSDLIRVHTVDRADNPTYHSLLLAAGQRTGLPVLYNTSFNLFGDPLVCTPRDAIRSFYSSGIDALIVGQFFLEK